MFFLAENYRHPAFREGVKDFSGLALGIAAWGLMTGVTMMKSGMTLTESVLMGILVFAGSSQLAAIPLLVADAPMWIVLATGFCVNLRFVVFSAHLRPYMMPWPRWKRLVLGYMTADLSYVQFVKRFPHPATDPAEQQYQLTYLAGNTGLNWLSWTTAGLIGIGLAQVIPTEWGLGFAGILALVGLSCSLASSKLRVVAGTVAGAAGVAAVALPLKLNVLVAIAVAVTLCMLLEKLPRPASEPPHE